MEMCVDFASGDIEDVQLAVHVRKRSGPYDRCSASERPISCCASVARSVFVLRIVGVEIERVVLVGGIIDLVADPHRIAMARGHRW